MTGGDRELVPWSHVDGDYEPASYWTERLTQHFSLRGVGHGSFDDAYNEWIYRAKGDALKSALDGIAPGSRALDVGSGVGWVVEQLRAAGCVVDGCDIAAVSVERLTERFPDCHFFQASVGADRLPIDDATYDLVTLLDVAYHITDSELWTRAVHEIARVMKPGGRLVITDRLDPLPIAVSQHVQFRSQADWGAAGGPVGLKFERIEPLFRLLSRGQDIRGWRHLSGRSRGAIEYALDHVGAGKTHLRWATLVKA